MKIYNKLIRDKIPEIMDKKRVSYKIKKLSDNEYPIELVKKLQEEVDEFKRNHNLEELADIVEVVDYLSQILNSSLDDVIKIKKVKHQERGGFDKKLFLEYTKE